MNDFNLNNNSNQSRKSEYNEIQKRLTSFYKEPIIKLMLHLQEKFGYSPEQIGEVVGISREAVRTNYLPSEQKQDSKANKAKSKGVTK